jgi:hypothetical protein
VDSSDATKLGMDETSFQRRHEDVGMASDIETGVFCMSPTVADRH